MPATPLDLNTFLKNVGLPPLPGMTGHLPPLKPKDPALLEQALYRGLCLSLARVALPADAHVADLTHAAGYIESGLSDLYCECAEQGDTTDDEVDA